MPFEVDPQFSATARNARSRKRRRLGTRLAILTLGLCLAVCSVWIFTADDLPPPTEFTTLETVNDPEEGLIQSQETARAAINVERESSFVDLRRDPIILRFAQTEEGTAPRLDAPEGFAKTRLARHGAGAIIGIRDTLFVAERRLVTTLPSSPNDFALFKAQRGQGVQDVLAAPGRSVVTQGQVVRIEEDSSWGALIASGDTAGPQPEAAAVYVETRIENTTSVAVTLREAARSVMYKDEVIALHAARQMGDVLRSAGISEMETDAVLRGTRQNLQLSDPLPEGSIVALRLRPDAIAGKLRIMSVYGPQGYLASLAQVGAGRFERAADPWIATDLMSRSDAVRADSHPPREVRLLDAVYSSAIRNGLPTKLVGELIVLMAQRFDLDRFAAEGDELLLLRAAAPSGTGVGQVLYAGIHTQSETMACYVLAAETPDAFSCFDFDQPTASGGGQGVLGGGFLVPVNGVKTSGFGPRHHPILKQVRNHNGVDWAAPTGTPVLAVAAGTVTRVGDGGGYGNVVYLAHANGVETRYAHLHGFAEGLRRGQKVAAGDVIGFVGTTGRSTGPHLHFELRVDGRPFDPLSFAGKGAGTGTQAVEALVDQIIRVESAGIATAKNPLSSATGLGQFIESTWLRMMRDYRPDLHRTMGRAQLLELRTDPALSREMVRNLARENEAFLRVRGHQITPGRLYLAHFLGPGGAHTALRADPAASVLSVMGARVVSANPFLRGKTIAALRAWSDRKMGRRGQTPAAPIARPVRVIPRAALAYREGIEALLTQL